MDAEGIARALRAQIVEDLFFGEDDVELGPTTDLFELGLDSLGINRLVVYLERTFGVRVGDDEIVRENFETLDAITALVQRHR